MAPQHRTLHQKRRKHCPRRSLLLTHVAVEQSNRQAGTQTDAHIDTLISTDIQAGRQTEKETAKQTTQGTYTKSRQTSHSRDDQSRPHNSLIIQRHTCGQTCRCCHPRPAGAATPDLYCRISCLDSVLSGCPGGHCSNLS